MKNLSLGALSICLTAFVARAETISGIVVDAAGGAALADARVQIDPTHFTMSGADGKFTLDLSGAVDVGRLISQPQARLAWHPEQRLLSWSGLSGEATVTVSDLRGVILTSSEKRFDEKFSTAALPQGAYVATVMATGHAPLSVLFNTLSAAPATPASATQAALAAKTAAAYNLGCYRTGYVTVWKPADGGATGIKIEMAKDPVGLGYHDFVFAGEWQHKSMSNQNLYVIKGGKVTWQWTMPGSGEYGDVSMLKDGNIVFSRGTAGASVISPDKQLLWTYKTRGGDAQVHTSQPIGPDKVFICENGAPLLLSVWNWKTNTKLWEKPIPTISGNTHGQMRHSRFLANGHLLLATMSTAGMVEYDTAGMKPVWKCTAKSVWAAVRLPSGNTLWSGNGGGTVTEVNDKGDTVWQIKKDEFKTTAGFSFATTQEAMRLKNGNTIINNWQGATGEPQIVEVTPDKKIVWILKSWAAPDLQYGSSTDILDEPGYMEDFEHYR